MVTWGDEDGPRGLSRSWWGEPPSKGEWIAVGAICVALVVAWFTV